jgi:F0F1-type ATP synthase gamma subunit
MGEKGTAALARAFPDLLIQAITELQNPINFYNVSTLTNYILKNHNDFEEYHIMYNRFVNTIQYKSEILKIMSKDQFTKRFNRLCTYDVSEPDSDVSLPYFYELYVASSLY